MTVELPAELQARLEAEASRRGVTLDQVIADLASRLPNGGAGSARRKPAFVSLGSSTSGRSARDADELLDEGFGRD